MNPVKLGNLLIAKGLISKEQLQSASAHQKEAQTRLGASLIKLGHVNENVLASFYSTQFGLNAVSLKDEFVAPEILAMVPKSLCEKYNLIPLAIIGNKLQVAFSDPTQVSAIDDVRFISNMEVMMVIAPESQITDAIERLYRKGVSVLGQAGDYKNDSSEETNAGSEAAPQSENIDQQSPDSKPVIKLINNIFLEAIRRKVSDIHIEPFEKLCRVRFRIDGSLHEMMQLPPSFRLPVPARIKVMANLDIAEKRLPQDGRIQLRTREKTVDVRVSLVPTIHGEKIVMRILDQGGAPPEMNQVGMEPEQLALFRKAAEQPYGMILVTGPTGSGKTTTLYAALSSLNTIDVNLSTAEDPVEYTLLGINQVHVKESIGMTFAGALRSFLRQDPDIIMVGEIRDKETASLAINASLTGHVVLSTLHTNSAAGAIPRLIDMKVEPFLLVSTINIIIAQRLVRKLTEAKEKYFLTKPEIETLGKSVNLDKILKALRDEKVVGKSDTWDKIAFYRPKKGAADAEAYAGRAGIHEVLKVSPAIKEIIMKGGTADEIQVQAEKEGMLTMIEDGIFQAVQGHTTIEEVLRVISE